MAVSITNGDGVTFTFQDGNVDTLKSNITSNIEFTEFPLQGPAGQLVFDFTGPVKTIDMTGQLTTATSSVTDIGTTTTILQQKQWLEELINGNQSAKAFTSTYESQSYGNNVFTSTTVFVAELSFDEKSGEANWLPYTLKLFVGSN